MLYPIHHAGRPILVYAIDIWCFTDGAQYVLGGQSRALACMSLDNEHIMISTQGAKGKQKFHLTYFNLELRLLNRSGKGWRCRVAR